MPLNLIHFIATRLKQSETCPLLINKWKCMYVLLSSSSSAIFSAVLWYIRSTFRQGKSHPDTNRTEWLNSGPLFVYLSNLMRRRAVFLAKMFRKKRFRFSTWIVMFPGILYTKNTYQTSVVSFELFHSSYEITPDSLTWWKRIPINDYLFNYWSSIFVNLRTHS